MANFWFALRVVAGLGVIALGAWARVPGVEFLPIEIQKKYPDAVAADALRYACSDQAEALEPFFAARQLRFEQDLVKKRGGRFCHIYFEPTLPGFHASPDDLPVDGLFIDIDLPGYLTMRTQPVGDALDVAKSVLPEVKRPLEVIFGVALRLDLERYAPPLRFHFPDSIHRYKFRDNTWDEINPWTQDYLKAGTAAGTSKILVTRMIFEGRAENGPLFKPMLDTLKFGRYTRSKLSWEGGDLQFLRHPKDASKLVLFYGDSAKSYWGSSLSDPEYQYVLRQEFGADEAVDLSDVVPHVDYFVSFIPREKIALVSQPQYENFELATEALEELERTLGKNTPSAMRELRRLFTNKLQAYGMDLAKIRNQVELARIQVKSWTPSIDQATVTRIHDHVIKNCDINPKSCLEPKGMAEMLDSNPALLKEWADAAARLRTEQSLPERVLSIVESQLPGVRVPTQDLIDRKVKELESLGLKVIRVPRVGGYFGDEEWAGLSYTNSTLIDKTIFMPTFGLERFEKKFIEKLTESLPEGYEVKPVFARHILLRSGGVHCIMGITRAEQ